MQHSKKNNEKKFNAFKLYKGKNDAPPFKIQWTEAEKYFTFLRTNVSYVGEAYIKAEKVHFKYSDSCFKANPTDEIAAGFDYDRWAGGQEDISYTYKWYTSKSNKYVVKITGDKATLKIGSKLNKNDAEAERSWSIVLFVKEKGKWVMADNIYPTD
jgi:flagellar hook protein FlgE